MWAISAHAALPLGGLFLARLSLLFLDLHRWQHGRYRLHLMPRPDLLMNLKKGYLLKKLLLKWANEKCKNFNIYNVVLFWKNKEKHLEISSFYPCVPKIMIRWCTVPEVWCMMDGEMDNRTEKVIYRGGCPT